jgi:ParB family chromosome partitioning protein
MRAQLYSRPSTERTKVKTVAFLSRTGENPAGVAICIEKIVLSKSLARRYFDKAKMESLVESVRRDGILQPLLVRPVGCDKYELVAGERRYKAALEVGLAEVPAVVREMSPTQAAQYALSENLQRDDLNPVEEVEGILQLLALKLGTDTQGAISLLHRLSKAKRGLADSAVRPEEERAVEEVFKLVGRFKPESFRTHRLPLLNLPPEVLDALRAGAIEYTKAREIAKMESEPERQALLKEAVEQSLSLCQINKRVRAIKPPKEEEQLQSRLEAAVKQIGKAKVWGDSQKRQQLDKLLAELEKFVAGEEV